MVQYAHPVHRRKKQFVSIKENCCYWPEHFQNQGLYLDDLPETADLVCFSHIRWDLVFQRPQHLMTRWASERRVFFYEEPVFENVKEPSLRYGVRDNGVVLVTPVLPHGVDGVEIQQSLVAEFISTNKIRAFVAWYLSPMFLYHTSGLRPVLTVYDCMDELTGFAGAPPKLREAELSLLKKADVVFTGGLNLFEAKRKMHHNIHAFPSSIDFDHFHQARRRQIDPEDQRDIAHPRLGFFGVIDERMNIELIKEIADARPDWHIVIIGPVLKIDPASLPQRPNIHYLGKKKYQELPMYLAGWDVAILPFALNEATRYISPTKTPEYLAAGRPVVSTSIRDVVRPYGDAGFAEIADTAEKFIQAIENCFNKPDDWLDKVDAFLARSSWNQTWLRMKRLIAAAWQNIQASRLPASASPVYSNEVNINV